MVKKIALSGILIIVAIIAGFILLLRGCLSAYDERAALSPVLYFEKDGKAVVFAIVKFEKATSYKRSGGFTSKTVSTNYYVQANDAVTGEKIDNKKIKHNSDIKYHPVTVLGNGGGKAWVFIGEPMAFDPLTLEKLADKAMIEDKNPALKGKMPDQRNHYEYNDATNELIITATDGLKYALSTATLIATATEEGAVAENPVQAKLQSLEKQQKIFSEQEKAHYDQFRAYNKLYMEKKMSPAAYMDSTKLANRRSDLYRKLRDSIRDEINGLRSLERAASDRMRAIDNLKSGSKSYTAILTDADTMNGQWYGLLQPASLENFSKNFQYRAVHNETARNRFYSARITIKDPLKNPAELQVDDPIKINDAVYLQGGFLLNRSTALPIHLANEDGFIICYREKTGHEGNIMLTRIGLNGAAKWTLNTQLPVFSDWIYTGKQLLILGTDNKELSSGDANLLIIIDLRDGKMTKHDYFKDK